jgi:hypothetical protein
MSLYTDANGQAVAHGFMPNNVTGHYVITVSATVGGLTVFALIHERNVLGAVDLGNSNQNSSGNSTGTPPHHHHTGRNVTIAATAAAVAVVLTILLTRHSPTSITAGGGTVGVP